MLTLNPPLQWAGQSVWLIGASTGIGRAVALDLARAGAQVAVSARATDALAATVAECQQLAPLGNILALPLDVTQRDSIDAAWQTLVNSGRAPSFVLFCAGTYKPMRAQALDLTELKRQLDVNYVGALNLLDVIVPPMVAARKGHISLVSSVAGYRGLPKSLAYGPTKAALTNLAETLYMDLKPEGVAVSVVCPGFVSTPLTAQNDFHMPALITPEQASQHMLAGWANGDFEVHYPKRFSRTLKALKLLPDFAYFKAVTRLTQL